MTLLLNPDEVKEAGGGFLSCFITETPLSEFQYHRGFQQGRDTFFSAESKPAEKSLFERWRKDTRMRGIRKGELK